MHGPRVVIAARVSTPSFINTVLLVHNRISHPIYPIPNYFLLSHIPSPRFSHLKNSRRTSSNPQPCPTRSWIVLINEPLFVELMSTTRQEKQEKQQTDTTDQDSQSDDEQQLAPPPQQQICKYDYIMSLYYLSGSWPSHQSNPRRAVLPTPLPTLPSPPTTIALLYRLLTLPSPYTTLSLHYPLLTLPSPYTTSPYTTLSLHCHPQPQTILIQYSSTKPATQPNAPTNPSASCQSTNRGSPTARPRSARRTRR
jgi:hypothetical protein